VKTFMPRSSFACRCERGKSHHCFWQLQKNALCDSNQSNVIALQRHVGLSAIYLAFGLDGQFILDSKASPLQQRSVTSQHLGPLTFSNGLTTYITHSRYSNSFARLVQN
jgi:hypothetical protein